MIGAKEQLREYLDSAREAVLYKSEGLAEQLARTPMTPTGTHVLGVLHHLAIVEYGYFGPCLNRPVDDDYARKLLELDDPQADFLPPAELSAAQIIGFYKKAVAFANHGIAAADLDAAAEVPWWVARRNTSLQHLLIHMIAETSRHAGHLDIVREQLDGFAGLLQRAPNLPEYSAAQWASQRARLQRIADAMPSAR